MSLTLRPRFRYALEMGAVVGLIASAPFAITALVGVLAPERFPFFMPLAGILAGILPFAVLFPLLFTYAWERRKHWIIGPDGIELWKAGKREQTIDWEKIHTLAIGKYTLRLQVDGARRFHYLTFVNRKGVGELIPAEKLQFLSQF